jgi:hypothetical protein
MRERSLSLLLPYKTVVSPVWTLSLKELKAQPERWLARIAERGIPTSIKLIEFPGTIDLDGLMKQFISTLVENLIEKKVFFRSELGLISSYRQEDIIRLNQLGKFFSYLDSKNNTQLDQLLTGTICHKRFLEFALIAIGDQSDEEKIRQAALLLAKIDPSQALVAKMLIEPSTELKLEFQAVMMASPGDEVNEAQAMLHSYITAAHAIYQGATPAFRIKISQNPVQTLLDVQGEEVSAVGLLRAILVEGDDERLHDQISWIQAFIRSADHALRRKFLKAATGRVTLSPSDRITIKQTLRHDPYFEFHTCLSSIALPQQDLTKEVFIEALKNALDERYNIA